MTKFFRGHWLVTAILFASALSFGGSATAQAVELATGATPRVIKIPAPAGAQGFGYALAYDGKTLVVGAPQTGDQGKEQVGAIYVYDLDPQKPESWSLNSSLVMTTGSEFTLLGEAVAVEENVIMAGAPRAEVLGVTQLGLVAFFERTPENPQWHRTQITYVQDIGAFANFGIALAIDDGRALIGAMGADIVDRSGLQYGQNLGAVFLFGRLRGEPGTWSSPYDLPIYDEKGQFNDEFGSAVAFSRGQVLVGAKSGDVDDILFGNQGTVYYYPVLNEPPIEVSRPLTDSQDADQFGSALALDHSDEQFFNVVGGYNIQKDGNSGVGGARIFKRGVGGHMVYASDGQPYDYFGYAVAAHKDVAVIAAPDADLDGLSDQGAVYRFEPTGTEPGKIWLETAKYTVPGVADGAYLGRSVAVHEGLVIAGANGADNGQGAVYLFVEQTAAANTQVFLPLVARRPPVTGILADNALVKDASGARIGVVEGTLTQPLGVFIQQSAAPTLSLTTTVTIVGDYFKMGATDLVYAPADKPFLVGLPVPVGADARQLAAAVLIPADAAEKAGDAEPTWRHIYGSYDAETRLFAFTLAQLTAEGVHTVLVSHPNHELLAFTPTGAVSSANPAATSFEVDCTWVLLPTAACSEANIAALKSQLFSAYTNFKTLGFREPALNRGVAAFTAGGEKPTLALLDRFYTVYIRPAPCSDKLGRFDPTTRTLEICVGAGTGVDAQVIRTLRHELFHAIQYAYPGLQADFARPIRNWVVEGTAAAAENSTGPLLRSPDFAARNLNHRLFYSHQSDEVAYQTQDFWVYLGQEQGVQLNYLIPIFEAGADLVDVNGMMGGNLGGNYWNWVKNQYYEKENTLNGALTKGACTAEEALANHTLTGYGLVDPNEKIWPGTLDRLGAAVYWVSIDDVLPNLTAFVTGNAAIRYKIYRDGRGGCTAVADSDLVDFTELTPSDTLIVLIANTSISASANYQVRVSRGE